VPLSNRNATPLLKGTKETKVWTLLLWFHRRLLSAALRGLDGENESTGRNDGVGAVSGGKRSAERARANGKKKQNRPFCPRSINITGEGEKGGEKNLGGP